MFHLNRLGFHFQPCNQHHFNDDFTTIKRLTGLLVLVLMMANVGSAGDPEAKRLYDDLLSHYNRLIRPVSNDTDTLTVQLGIKLAQIVDVNLKYQIMTTNLWVQQTWYDYKMRWSPSDYGGVESINVPAEQIWLPDIVLFNNADGTYEATMITKATLRYDGQIQWNPPALYKSSCEINVEFFPFDEQSCLLKFGSWTYDGLQVDLQHVDQVHGSNIVSMGIDLKEFILSVEWDILEVPATRHEEYDPCCPGPFTDITFNITMRRKTLFYTVNLILPCVGITFLTVLVFYIPSESGEKISLCISILLSLTVFFLLLAEIIPPSSLAVPLLGKYLLFTMILVTLSIVVTVGTLNVHFRSPSTHQMPQWMRRLFLEIMPRLLLMHRPHYDRRHLNVEYDETVSMMMGRKYGTMTSGAGTGSGNEDESGNEHDSYHDLKGHGGGGASGFLREPDFGLGLSSYKLGSAQEDVGRDTGSSSARYRKYSPEVERAMQDVQFIAQHMRDGDRDRGVSYTHQV
ncbi:D-arabinose 1-dehydrogenase (NAD(P)(+)), variant 2 [Chamberlinius hualienensis]